MCVFASISKCHLKTVSASLGVKKTKQKSNCIIHNIVHLVSCVFHVSLVACKTMECVCFTVTIFVGNCKYANVAVTWIGERKKSFTNDKLTI